MENRDVFVSERRRTSARFTKPIHKTTITTFASKSFERKNKSKKVAELQVTKSTRDLFRRLLDLSATNGIDLENVISFPILPVSCKSMDSAKTIHVCGLLYREVDFLQYYSTQEDNQIKIGCQSS